MGKAKLKPKTSIISFRVSDAERTHLEAIVERDKRSISAIMRETIGKN